MGGRAEEPSHNHVILAVPRHAVAPIRRDSTRDSSQLHNWFGLEQAMPPELLGRVAIIQMCDFQLPHRSILVDYVDEAPFRKIWNRHPRYSRQPYRSVE